MMLRKRSMDDLSDDELTEILIRLPVNCVHRFRCVSEHWLNLTSEPSFVDSFIQIRTNSTKRLSLKRREDFLLYQQSEDIRIRHIEFKPHSEYSPKTKFFDFSLGFLPALRDRKRLHTHHQLCPCSPNTGSQYEKLVFFYLLRVYEGLMLCEAGFSCKTHIFYVCDPLTQQWLELPPSPWHQYTSPGSVGFICTETTLTIIHVTDYGDQHFNIDLFSSSKAGAAGGTGTGTGTGAWRQFRIPFPQDFRWPFGNMDVIVCKGRFHWNGRTSMVVYDPLSNPYCCDSVRYPVESIDNYTGGPLRRAFIAVSEGHIRLCRCGRKIKFGHEIWVWNLVDYDKSEWSPTYKFPLMYTHQFVKFSETNGQAFYTSITPDNANYIACYYMPMHGNGIFHKSDFRQHPHKLGHLVLPYAMTLWPTSLRNFKFNSTSAAKEEETGSSEKENT